MDIVATWIKGIYMYLINKVRFIFLRCSIPKQFVGEVRVKIYKKTPKWLQVQANNRMHPQIDGLVNAN